MMKLENQIPRFDTIRKNFESRYYAVDTTLSGRMRFAYGISNDEAVLKDGTYAKCTEPAISGDISLKVDNKIYGIDRNSYIKVKDNFYLVNYVEGNTIHLYNPLNTDLYEGDIVKLFSTNLSIDNEGVCSRFEFKIGTTIAGKNFTHYISENDTIEGLVKEISKYSTVHNFGNTIWALGEWTSTLSYFKIYEQYPYESGFLNIRSNNFIVVGDELALFNEDIRANNTVKVAKLEEKDSAYGFFYTVLLDGLSGSFKYGQLKAYPAYVSKKINIQNLKPSLLDICYGTVYGKDLKLIKGFKKFYLDSELTSGFEDLKYISELNTEPSDLWINEVLAGSIQADLPNLVFTTDNEGVFRLYVDSKIEDEFVLKFKSTNPFLKVSITDVNGNILVCGKSGEHIKSNLNKVTINIKSTPNDGVIFDTFKILKTRCTHIQYYFVCPETSNERVEVNGLHLNPIFKNYRELLAVIGRDKVGEGRIAL